MPYEFNTERLRKEFEEEIYKCRAKNLRQDVIVRHVDRVDNYPNVDDRKGISSWFRVALLDTYERGIVLGLSFGGLVECGGGYRFADWVNGEIADVRALLMGTSTTTFLTFTAILILTVSRTSVFGSAKK